ncbi:cytochrome P450 [Kutzneria sp. 744]|uniref:cytochrome P450 family protein n=1 Tax=Kutzneria sp. (strain 744) TaxID=345341 RepID=UPI0003EEB509|nr:cytochrome P450 [Kutzneria sp. 744]EWM15421.1 cytochrome P450 107B1 [Kutzneria sp. 744]
MTREMFTEHYFAHVHEFMATARAEEPVFLTRAVNGVPTWVVTRYDDVRALLTDDRLSKDSPRLVELLTEKLIAAGREPKLNNLFGKHMLNSDPPDHTRLRLLLAKDFTARRVALLRPFTEQLTENLLTALATADGPVDVVDGFSVALPAMVISELLGVPPEDRHEFQAWTGALLSGDPVQYVPADQAINAYMSNLIAQKSATPGDDLLSAMTRASEEGDRLSTDEVLAMALLLLVAGHETTANLISSGIRRLLTTPGLAEQLLADPAPVVEEMLRVDTPVMLGTSRFTTVDVEVGGVTIPAGEIVALSVGSANHDEERFADSAEFDLDRGARGHIAFGHGLHHCLGAPLARLEAEVALTAFARQFPQARLAVPVEQLPHRHAAIMNGHSEMPVVLGARAVVTNS